jgi:hypothetical protein
MAASIAVEKDTPRDRQTDDSPQLKLEYLLEILNDKASSQIEGVVVDFCSAQMALQVYPGVGKDLRRRLPTMPVSKMVRS